MGNDNSKATLDNQQLIMQLQQQILQQQQQNNNVSRPIHIPKVNNVNPNANQPLSVPHILHNKDLLHKIDQNPVAKRKLLEKLLNEQSHVMSSQQIIKINSILNTLPPLSHESTPMNFVNPQSISAQDLMPPGTFFNQGTTKQDLESKHLMTTQQYNDTKTLSHHYKSEIEEEEALFKREEIKRRKEFEERQHQRRAQYQAKLLELEKNDIDALKIFLLKPNYSLDELKIAYKKLALKVHPDKPTGNKEQFQLITKCYMLLLEKYKNRESDKQFTDLRQGSKSFIEDQTQKHVKSKHLDKDKFDLKLFNKIYEDNKLWESNDDGYGDFMKKDNEEKPTELFGNKFNINVFNSTFEDYKDKSISQNNSQIQEYKDPKELVSCATGFTELDIYNKKINDYSKPLPVAGLGSKNELPYTDLKTAYTTRGAFIDPSKVEYTTYKSIDDLKKARGNIKFDMSPAELALYEQKQYREQQEEDKRQQRIRERDSMSADIYGKLHERMLGYKGSAPS
jgi:curved DNA-binding protein CbpA